MQSSEPSYWNPITKQRLQRRRLLRGVLISGAGAGVLGLIGCGGGDTGGKAVLDKSGLIATPLDTTSRATAGGVLKDFQQADFINLDPYTSSVNNVRLHGGLAYPRIMKFVLGKYPKLADSTMEGDLMESYEISGDKLQVTFKLRPGLKWDARPPTNGRVIDAQDVVSSWTRFAAVNSYGAPFFVYDANNAPMAPVVSVSAPDRSTIVMKLHRPDGSLLIGLGDNGGYYAMPRESEGGFDPKRDIRGHGPWMLEEWRPSAYVHWKRNPEYYVKGRPYFDRLERPIVTEPVQQLAQFKAGNIYTSLVQMQEIIQTKKDVPQTSLRQEEAFFAAFGPYLRFGYEGDSPFKDVRLRQATSYCLDRAAFMDVTDSLEAFRKEGIEVPVAYNTAVAAGWPGFWLDPTNEKEFGPSAKYLKYDRAEAKKLMAAAGFANGLDFDFFYNQDNNYGASYARIRDVYAGMLLDVGFRPRMQGRPYAIYLEQYHWGYISKQFASGEKKGFNGMIHSPAGAVRASIDAQLYGTFHRDGGTFVGFTPDGRNAHLGDPKVNDLIEKMLVEFDRKRQQSLSHDFIRYFTEQAYVIPRPGVSKNLNLTWPVIGNEGVWNTVGVPQAAGANSGPGNPYAESRLNWWYDASQPPAKA